MTFKRSPYHYAAQYLNEDYKPKPHTEAMIFGELVHTWTLEPHLFEERFTIKPKVDRRTTAGKAAYKTWEETAAGKIIISSDDFDLAQKVCLAVRKDGSLAESLMVDATFEESIFFTHATTGIQCKIRPDIRQGAIVSDLKTAKDGSYRAFQNAAYGGGYFLQASMIKQGLLSLGVELERFVFIVVEKEPPFAVALYLVNEEALLWGEEQFDALMEKLARCRDKQEWPGYGVQNLMVPGYAKFEVEIEE